MAFIFGGQTFCSSNCSFCAPTFPRESPFCPRPGSRCECTDQGAGMNRPCCSECGSVGARGREMAQTEGFLKGTMFSLSPRVSQVCPWATPASGQTRFETELFQLQKCFLFSAHWLYQDGSVDLLYSVMKDGVHHVTRSSLYEGPGDASSPVSLPQITRIPPDHYFVFVIRNYSSFLPHLLLVSLRDAGRHRTVTTSLLVEVAIH